MPSAITQRPNSSPEAARAFAQRVLGLPARALAMLYVWQARVLERQELARLDDRQLRDAGLSRYDIANEISKSFWRA